MPQFDIHHLMMKYCDATDAGVFLSLLKNQMMIHLLKNEVCFQLHLNLEYSAHYTESWHQQGFGHYTQPNHLVTQVFLLVIYSMQLSNRLELLRFQSGS